MTQLKAKHKIRFVGKYVRRREVESTMWNWSAVTAFSFRFFLWLTSFEDFKVTLMFPDSSAWVPSSLRAVMSSLHTLWKCHGLRLRALLYFFSPSGIACGLRVVSYSAFEESTAGRVLTQNFRRGSNVTFYIMARSEDKKIIWCDVFQKVNCMKQPCSNIASLNLKDFFERLTLKAHSIQVIKFRVYVSQFCQFFRFVTVFLISLHLCFTIPETVH